MEVILAQKIYLLLQKKFECDGIFYFEMIINNLKEKCLCDMVIYFPKELALIAIELKDWKNNVTMSTAKKEFEGYRYIFDYFYLVAPKFSEKLIHNLIGIGSEKVIQNGLFKMGLIQINRDIELFKNAEKFKDDNWDEHLKLKKEADEKTELKIINEPFRLCVYSHLREDFIRRLKFNWDKNKKSLIEKYPFAKFEIPPKTKEKIEDKDKKLSEFMEEKI